MFSISVALAFRLETFHFFNKAFGGFIGFNGIYLKLVYIIGIVLTKIHFLNHPRKQFLHF
ncbi:hypothetical protein DW828_19945 [Parabacteroides merdae]|uniref:Uncharacterized protein n=1 Tax=Parabacteroides merdae TaxID=46503 RepID=A0A414BQ79_9BACT|nr:hypothetical protein DW828_19945 [Parabacteroides merdae]